MNFFKEFFADVRYVYNKEGLLHTLKILGLLYLYYGLIPTINILLFFWIWWVGLIMLPFTMYITYNTKISK